MKKNILFVHHTNVLGGGLLSLFDIVKSLYLKEDFNITIAIPKGSTVAFSYASKYNVSLYEFHKKVPVLQNYSGCPNLIKILVGLVLSLSGIFSWYSYLKSNRYKLVVLNSIVLVPLIPLLKLLNIKSCVFIRETKSKNIILNIITKFLLNLSTSVVFLTEYDLNSWKLDSSVNTVIIPDMVRQDEVCNISVKRDDKIRILYTGGISYLKGIDTFIKSLNSIQSNKEFIITICGYCNNKPHKFLDHDNYKAHKTFNYALQTSVHKDKINLIGVVEDIHKVFSESDFLVIPFNKPHQARGVYEAGLHSIPVIAPDYTCFDKIVVDGKNGLLFEAKSSYSLAQKIDFMLDNPNERSIMGINNKFLTHGKNLSSVVEPLVDKFFENLVL